MKIFDEVLNQEVEVHELVDPKNGKEIKIDDPIEITNIIKEGEMIDAEM